MPRLVGRTPALEIVLSDDDFEADIAERYGWVNRAMDDAALDEFVEDGAPARLVRPRDAQAIPCDAGNRS